MKRLRTIFLCFGCLYLLSACSDDRPEAPESSEIVQGEGIGVSYITHDTPKIGIVNFSANYDKDSSASYVWRITDSNGEDITTMGGGNTEKNYSYDFTVPGEYTVSVIVTDGSTAVESKGVILIPETQKFSIDLSQTHTLIAFDKSLYVYGLNDKGQLCTSKSDTKKISKPSILKGYEAVQSVGTGRNHSLFADGTTLYACGDNTEGVLGVEGIEYSDTPVAVDAGGLTGKKNNAQIIIGAGDRISIVGLIVQRGTSKIAYSYAWGWGGPDNPVRYIPSPTMTGNASNGWSVGRNQFVAAGEDFAVLALTGSNSTYAYGSNDRWRSGANAKSGDQYYGGQNPDSFTDDSYIGFNLYTQQVWVPYGSNSNQGAYMSNPANSTAAAGQKFTIKKHGNEAIYIFGDNSEGQIGLDDLNGDEMVRRGAPLFIYPNLSEEIKTSQKDNATGYVEYNPITADIIEIAAGSATGFALSSDGILYGWGRELQGQLGSSQNRKTNTVNSKIYEIANPENVTEGYKKIWAGGDRVIALAGDDNLYTWGDNKDGILGIESITEERVLAPAKLMFDIRSAE